LAETIATSIFRAPFCRVRPFVLVPTPPLANEPNPLVSPIPIFVFLAHAHFVLHHLVE